MVDNCLIVMVKDPEKGEVKSRLANKLGRSLTTDLYRAFVADIITTTAGGGEWQLEVAFFPPNSCENIRNWLGNGISLMEQTGSHLGERMLSVFLKSFAKGYSKVVLIGSDLPDLPGHVLRDAFSGLDSEGIALGPALDGGYYLIGFEKGKFLPEVFDDINWSTSTVFDETVSILAGRGCKIHILPSWGDIDTLEDLKSLYARHEKSDFHYSATMTCIKENRANIL